MRMGSVRAGALGLAVLFTLGAPAAAQEPALQFDASTRVTISDKAVVVSVFNNGPRALRALSVTATLDPAPDKPDGPLQHVTVQVDLGEGFRLVTRQLTFPPGRRMRILLVAPSDARAGATGWLTVSGRSARRVATARRELAVEGGSSTPAVTKWKVTSVQWVPFWHAHRGGEVGARLPLTSSCAATTGPSGHVVDDDRAIAISSTCSGSKLELHADHFPRTGTYSGKLGSGDTAVDLEVRRTMAVIWPILMILIGVVLALWSQGQLDSGARFALRRAIRRLRRDARGADVEYARKGDGTQWEKYELEGAVNDAADALLRELKDLAIWLPPWLRWLPWPDGYMAEEQKALRTKLADLDQLVHDWPSLPDDFAAAQAALTQRPGAIADAPELVARALIVLGAAGGPFDTKELQKRRDEARAGPEALRMVDELVRVRDYLAKFGYPLPSNWPAEDVAAFVRARQYVRQATAMFADASDATLVKPQIGPVLEHASRLASRLAAPGATQVAAFAGRQQAAGGGFLWAPIVSIGRVVGAFRTGVAAAGPAAAVFLALAIGILSGLPTLYIGKGWGTPADYAAAIVWGYLASTIVTPIVGLVKQLGARPRDAAVPSARA
jgi:hypothetical protein